MSDTSRPPKMNNNFFREHSREKGLVLDFNDAAKEMDFDGSQDYVQAMDYRLHSTFSRDAEAVKARSAHAETHIIATCDDVDQENLADITCDAMTVKRAGDMHIALPEAYDFTLSRINAAALDALKLYGPEVFEETSMLLIVQRTDVDPGDCHRPHISNWHDHISGGQNTDTVYLFHNKLGTEYRFNTHKGQKIDQVEIAAPDNTLARVGGEIIHRPQTNQGDELRREWGALIVNIKPAVMTRASNYRSDNNALVKADNPLFDAFKQRAQEILDADTRLHVLDEPQTLIEYTQTDVSPT